MDADQKRYFCTLCSTGNITRAAEELYISRQGLSKSMKVLEDQLGATLFERSKTGVELTDAGRILLRYIREEDKLWNTCMADIAALGKDSSELIRIGMQIMYFGYEEKRRLLASFQDDPRIRIEVVDGDHDFFWDSIIAGKMEFAFSVAPTSDRDIPQIKLSDDSLAILLSVDDPLAQATCVDFRTDLRGKTVIQTSPYKGRLYETAIKNHGLKSEHLAPDKDLMLARVATDRCCFIIQSQYAKVFVTNQVCMKPLINAPIEMDSYFVFRSDLSPAARIVAQTLLEAFGKSGEFSAYYKV